MSDLTALTHYREDMRRRRVRYYAGIAVATVLLAVFAGVEWSRGETAHVTLHTVGAPPSALALASPSLAQHLSWRTSDRLALGTPQHGGTVITYSAHTVRGRDVRTGAPTWSYTRTDRSVCDVVAIGGTAIAIFAVGGNCDEVTALNSDTGQRTWTRTLDKDGMPVDGRPSYGWTSSTLLVTSHGSKDDDSLYAIDPVGGIDQWTYTRHGCRIGRAVIGTSGVLISQNCTRPDCSTKKFCAAGPQLLLRDATAGNKNDKPNGDQFKWLDKGNRDVPVSAGQVLAALNPSTGALDRFTADSGRSLGSAALHPAPGAISPLSAGSTSVDTVTADVVWVGGVSYAFTAGRDDPLWSVRTRAAPTVVSTTGADELPQLPTARITVPTESGVAILDGNDGKVLQSFRLPAATGATTVLPLGSGFLIGSASGTTAYR